eukprot:8607051-Alexandrium_andersonii.AAC.1
MSASLVGSEMCIRDSSYPAGTARGHRAEQQPLLFGPLACPTSVRPQPAGLGGLALSLIHI